MQLVQQISAKIGHKCEVSPTHSLSLSLSPLLTNILHPGFAYGTSTFCSRIRCSVWFTRVLLCSSQVRNACIWTTRYQTHTSHRWCMRCALGRRLVTWSSITCGSSTTCWWLHRSHAWHPFVHKSIRQLQASRTIAFVPRSSSQASLRSIRSKTATTRGASCSRSKCAIASPTCSMSIRKRRPRHGSNISAIVSMRLVESAIRCDVRRKLHLRCWR